MLAGGVNGNISADATDITVSGGLFGCGEVVIDRLEGRTGNGAGTTRAATVVADLNGDEVLGLPFSFTNGGGNLCGCEEIATDCKLQAAQLQPPPLPQ